MRAIMFLNVVLIPLALLAQGPSQVGDSAPSGQVARMGWEKPGESAWGTGDSIWSFIYDKDKGLFGIEYDGEFFYLPGDNDGGARNMVYVFDRNGQYVREFAQMNKNDTPSDWGWLDLAYRSDHGYFFGSDDSMITAFDKSGKNLYRFPGPLPWNVGLAWDGQYLWVSDQYERIYKVDTTGAIIASYPNTYWTWGLAWDDASPGNPWLWVSAVGEIGPEVNRIYQFDPIKGEYTGFYIQGAYLSTPGGLAFSSLWDRTRAVLFELCQRDPDFVCAYDLGPITVRTAQGFKQDALKRLESLEPTGDPKLDREIDKVIRHIEKSLKGDHWVDESRLEPRHGHEVFCEEKTAIHEIEKLCDKCHGDDDGKLPSEVCNSSIMMLAEADSTLALVAIRDARADSSNPREIERAEKEFSRGLEEISENRPNDAVEHFEHAWEHAMRALYKHHPHEMMAGTGSESSCLLFQNAPNPARSSTRFEFALDEPGSVRLTVYDISGRLVWELAGSDFSEGQHSVEWDCVGLDGMRVPSGAYLYRLETKDFAQTRRMMIIR
jgi:hypothetical protein